MNITTQTQTLAHAVLKLCEAMPHVNFGTLKDVATEVITSLDNTLTVTWVVEDILHLDDTLTREDAVKVLAEAGKRISPNISFESLANLIVELQREGKIGGDLHHDAYPLKLTTPLDR